MNKYTAFALASVLFTCAIGALANNSTSAGALPNVTCKKIEMHCEQAIVLKDALYPYYEICRDGAVDAYKYAHDLLEKQVPEQVFEYTTPFATNATVSNYLAHAGLAFGAVIVAQGVKAMTAIPLSIVKFPFSNRATVFLTGVIAKSLYDSYNQKKEQK